ncbi:protein kinase domain protein [Ichthyophthirius multifiliis]|uniref:non-specific serine/threonine protein kinase n=1 Tax=Ichthyophthirius multifiliis TaxID=5932 RepID=G0QJ88_ICHMU|nr:protein kinase domain protein [Ichthyophthirius multifiliis]EGR34717.1 protein kinase domain protein [Ichthyophthirius multifiliis]|eukprot:XP_004040021.1 protein kinase domain protein [Ichthyophthirius multifiliis]
MSINGFSVLKKLGEGSFSSVFKVKRLQDNEDYAMKDIKMGKLTQKEKENTLNEIRFLASINSPNVVQFKEAFFEEKNGVLHIIMEFCGGGDLLNKINEKKIQKSFFEEKIIWKFINQLLLGLKYLHDLNIIHRDLKCANVFLSADEETLKLGDLNVSKQTKNANGMLYTQTGTPYYCSPEVWKDKPYDYKSDIWSLGCVVYEMTMLEPPFKARNMEELYKKVMTGKYRPIHEYYSQDLNIFISKCLQVNPKNRLGTEELLKQFKQIENREVQEKNELIIFQKNKQIDKI